MSGAFYENSYPDWEKTEEMYFFFAEDPSSLEELSTKTVDLIGRKPKALQYSMNEFHDPP